MHTHTRVHTHARLHTHTHTRAHTHACTHTHTQTLAHTHTHKRLHTQMSAHTHTHARTIVPLGTLGAAGAALTAPAVGAPPAFIHPALEDQECCAVDTQAWLVSYRAADL